MRGLILLAALTVAVPVASAAAQSGPSIHGWALPGPPSAGYDEPPPTPLWNNPDRAPIDDDDDLPPLPSAGSPSYPPQASTNPPPSPYMNDPVQLRPLDPPPPVPDDRAMPPDWRPGYPNNQLGMGHPAPPPVGIPARPQSPTFRGPHAEAPGAVTDTHGGDRGENAIQTLLDQGYSRINPVQPDGRGFVTYAERDGVEMRLWVNPDTGEVNRLPD